MEGEDTGPLPAQFLGTPHSRTDTGIQPQAPTNYAPKFAFLARKSPGDRTGT
jgi:hypothetical protein